MAQDRALAEQRALGELMQESLVGKLSLRVPLYDLLLVSGCYLGENIFAFIFCPIRRAYICRGHGFFFGGVLFLI